MTYNWSWSISDSLQWLYIAQFLIIILIGRESFKLNASSFPYTLVDFIQTYEVTVKFSNILIVDYKYEDSIMFIILYLTIV